MQSPKSPNNYRTIDAKRYAEHTARVRLQTDIKYYRRRKKDGEDWHPKPFSKLYIWAKDNNLEPDKLITGEQKLDDATIPPT